MLPVLDAVRYVMPFRQGGSLPALVEASDGQLYVMKFAGAGQGVKALAAELLAGEIGRALGLRVPELALIDLAPAFAAGEPNLEIRDLLKASVGRNLGLRFLPNALEYNPMKTPPLTRLEAATIVWFDAYVINVDRTPRNVNMLLYEKQLWLIDHGASLYFHHRGDWTQHPERSRTPFPQIKDHALLSFTAPIDEADRLAAPVLTDDLLAHIVGLLPDAWLRNGTTPDEARAGYAAWLSTRRDASAVFVDEANHARSQRV